MSEVSNEGEENIAAKQKRERPEGKIRYFVERFTKKHKALTDSVVGSDFIKKVKEKGVLKIAVTLFLVYVIHKENNRWD